MNQIWNDNSFSLNWFKFICKKLPDLGTTNATICKREREWRVWSTMTQSTSKLLHKDRLTSTFKASRTFFLGILSHESKNNRILTFLRQNCDFIIGQVYVFIEWVFTGLSMWYVLWKTESTESSGHEV